jgi:hypothetical protein
MDIQARNEAIGFCKKYIDEHGGGGGETTSEIATIVNKLGAKNLLINVGADSATNQGVTFTKSADGTVSATRVSSATNTATYNIVDSANLNTDHYANLGEVILSGTPADGSANICVMLRQTSDTGHIYYNGVEVVDTDGTGALVDLDHCTLDAEGTTPIGRDDMRIIIRISKAEEPNNVVFKPMLRYKGIEDGTYAPYVKTNAEATTDLQKLVKLTNPKKIGNMPQDDKFDEFGFKIAPYWSGAWDDGELTLDNKVNANDITVQYTLDVETTESSTTQAMDWVNIYLDKNSMLLDSEYLIFTVTVHVEGTDIRWGIVPSYFDIEYIDVGFATTASGAVKFGVKVGKGSVFTGLTVFINSLHNISSGYSSTNYVKITEIKKTSNDADYNACNYKF